MLRVETLDELFAAVETLGSGVRVAVDRLAIIPNGGGIGARGERLRFGGAPAAALGCGRMSP
jgi:hypothetical protein